ncbi:MAG: CBS domain-containing protein [Gammaproteobacteria bacterium]|nr:CBS domain-containing protein [Gammaproteobacteria bacterium]
MVGDDGELKGIISERDYARKVILKNRSSQDTRVEEIMTTDVIVVSDDASLGDCMGLMTRHKIRHLPVVDGDGLVGIISVGDVVKQIIDEQSSEIDHLERYIRGETQA